MTKIIPYELIKHLEWVPGQEVPQMYAPMPAMQSVLSIDELVKNGKEFYSEEKDSEGKHYIGVAVALQQAQDEMGTDAVIASMPYLIAGKTNADKKNYLWQNWFTALSEENAGIDKNGRLVGAGEEIVITLHGGGILTHERIRKAYSEELTPEYAAKYTNDEFGGLLKGTLPSGESINLYNVDDVKRGIPEPFGRYAVWMPAEAAKTTASNWHKKKEFMENPLVIARAGTLEHIEAYFEKAKSSDKVGNWHRFGEIDFQQPQGRLLFVSNTYNGLYGYNILYNLGRFVGVAPEALVGARKIGGKKR
ncbi:MAG: hypothetical protein KJ955_02040 [Nanoarchaeota archaeon]|nr:hypothetical protein [Nanoarchaeota archaeon]